jgi:phosphoribosyl 1,2-cyclic phosphodiesterase
MKVWLKGVRGSIPTTGSETSHYGGDTSCQLVEEGNWTLVLDGGSGMQKLKIARNPEISRVDILLTHLHLDHIQGLGFFRPLFDSTMEVHIWGPASSNQTLHARLSRYLSPPLFPVLLRDLPCKLVLHEIENSQFSIGPFNIQSAYIIHPSPTVGFRISNGRSIFTYIPDHEPALSAHGLPQNKKWVSGIDLAMGADLLYHDAQFSMEEYKTKMGWGHSAMEDAIQFAGMAEVKHLLLGHHDPSRTDVLLSELFEKVIRNTSTPVRVELAYEGMEIELS